MSDPYHVTVNAGWALLGKQPGTDRDYSVMASSDEPLSGPEFASVLRHFMPGTPPTERERPDSLPWVTISRVRVADQIYLGIAIMDRDPDGQVDVARRPITRTSYFCIRYLEPPGTRISYYGLYEQMARLELPYPNSDLIPLSVPLLDPEAAADEIRRFGEPVVRAAAARMLTGPVSILGAEKTSLDQRLRFLDAVAALLPYGYRTSFSAATWSDSGARHPIRLAFATRPRQDAGVVKWASSGQGAITGVGDQYQRLIAKVIERREDDQLPASPDPLTALVRFLAEDTEPRGFDQPEEACARVRDFGLPFIVWDEVEKGTEAIADVRAVFRRQRIGELPRKGRWVLLKRLFFSGEDDDWGLIREWRVVAVGDDPADLLALLSEACYGKIWISAPSMASRISGYLRLADEHYILDALLARLAEVPASRADLADGLRAAAQAIADGLAQVPDLAACPFTWAALAKNPVVTCELLAHLASSGPPSASSGPLSVRTANWLMSVDQVLLTPFSVVYARVGGVVRLSDIDRLAEADEECVRALLDTASCLGRLDRALGAFATWLGRAATAPGGRHRGVTRDWCQFAAGLDRGQVASQAWLDLVLLICQSPRFLSDQRDLRGWRRYNEYLVKDWEDLASYLGHNFDELITVALADYLETGDRASVIAQFSGIEDLVERLTVGNRRYRLRRLLEEIRPQAGRRRRRTAQEMREEEETQERNARPREWVSYPEASPRERPPRHEETFRAPGQDLGEHPYQPANRDAVLDTLRLLPPKARIIDITGSCVEALEQRVEPDAVGRTLAEYGAIGSGERAALIIRRLRDQLGTSPQMSTPDAEEWLYSLAVCFTDEEMFDPQFARDFAEFDTRHIISEIYLNLRWLRVVPPDQLGQILQDLENEILALRKSLSAKDGTPGDSTPNKRKIYDFIPWGNPEKKAKSQEGETG